MHEKVKKAQAGDITAFGELVKMFQDAVYGVAYAMLGNFHDAQDIAQEAFIQAWRDLGSLKEPAKFPNWLCRIAKNRCMDFLRQAKFDIVELEKAKTMQDPLPSPLEQAEKKELAESVLAAVRMLPEQLRLTTTLFYINGYTVSEISEFLEAPVGTIKRRLHDSRLRLKEIIMKDKKMIEIMVGDTLKSFPLPGDFADFVVRKATSQEDLKRAAELVGWHAKNRPEHFKSVEDAEKAGLYIVGEEGSVDGAGYFNEIDWSIGSVVFKAVRPGEMGGESEGVPDPVFVKSFHACFKLAKQRGIHLAIVHGSQYDHAFCGFVPCFYYAVATLPLERAKSIVTCATFREPYNEEEKEAALDAIARDPYTTKMYPYTIKMSAGPVRVVEHNGVPGGYITLAPNGDISNGTLKTREAALAVIKLIGEQTEKAGGKEILVMESHMTMLTQTILSLGGKYLLRPSCDLVGLDAEMVAIINLVGLTQDLQGEFQSRLDASPAHNVDGRFSIEMSGTTVGFVVNSGRVEVVTQKQKVHRILPRWVVTRLYMGYYSGEDVLAMGPIPYDRSDGKNPDDPDLDMKELHLPENEAALFKALFPKMWPCSCPDPDVWPWVIGAEGPRYQHEDLKTPEMKALIDALRFPWIGY
jgi:RNA polymerase sigma factor (sigma-70 family)